MRAQILGLAILGVLGCERAEPVLGSECSLNSDCATPLVCTLQRCRRQCLDSRDCGAGLLCLRRPEGNACQLEQEASCGLTSDCGGELVCSFGTCTTECIEDRDCVAGATCESDGARNSCVEPTAEACVYDSDCPAPYVCARDQQCHIECNEDRDCRAPRQCVLNVCQRVDGG